MKYCPSLSKGHTNLYLVRNVWYLVMIFGLFGKASLYCTSELYGVMSGREFNWSTARIIRAGVSPGRKPIKSTDMIIRAGHFQGENSASPEPGLFGLEY